MIRVRLRLDGQDYEVALTDSSAVVDGLEMPLQVRRVGRQALVSVGGDVHSVVLRDARTAAIDGQDVPFAIVGLEGVAGVGAASGAAHGPIHPPMPGRIEAVAVAEGQEVQAGEILFVLEAMKMRNEVRAPGAGRVRGIQVRPGDAVEAGHVVLHVDPL